jgi:GDPmannose 4,6-dehydratase
MANKVAFITGINGQDGSYLSENLLEKAYYVHGILRRMSLMNTERIDHIIASGNDHFSYNYGDVTDFTSLYRNIEDLIKKHPESRIEVYHLAAQSHVKVSFDMPEYTSDVDAMGTLKVLEVCRTLRDMYKLSKDQLRIYIACTSELYGEVLEIPQTERTPFNPRSPYAVAKQFAFYIAKNYREAYDMYISNGILFNHESPRRGFNFVTRKITLGIGKIVRGESECLYMGNIDSVRDWGHAKDYVEAMNLILGCDNADDFVVATNEPHSVREFIEKAFAEVKLIITWNIDAGRGVNEIGVDQNDVVRVRINPKYYRPTEVEYLQGDAAKAFNTFGWKPKISFDELVKEMVRADLFKE